jgi:HD-like signal output (HDOD) protein
LFGLFKKQPEKLNPPAIKQSAPSAKDHLVEAVLISGVVLPPYPTILEKIDRLLQRDDFPLSELATLIEHDAGLTAALMRVANSPVFGLSKTVTNIEQAFSILGTGRVQAILRSELLRNALKDYGNPHLLTYLWNRFNKISELATALANQSPLLKAKTDLIYMTAMFHGTGSFILLKRYPLKANGILKTDGDFEQQITQLNEVLNTDHTVIGGMVAKSWRLPMVVIDAIAGQRDSSHTEGLTGILIQLLQAAILLHDSKLNSEAFKPIADFLTTKLGIDSAHIESLISSSSNL